MTLTEENMVVTKCCLAVLQVLRVVLINWDALKLGYYRQFGRELPFLAHKATIHQLYSLLHAVVDVVKKCQASEYPTAVSGYYALVRLRTVELDLSKPLPLIQPDTQEPVYERLLHDE
jgi:hypothetical protein